MSQSANWIRPLRREAIYIRDDRTCVYCQVPPERQIYKLTLDHIRPRSRGGSNHYTNLVTACRLCNERKANKSLAEFIDDKRRETKIRNAAKRRIERIYNALKFEARVEAEVKKRVARVLEAHGLKEAEVPF